MRQANELGGHVRKGEESTVVVFWKVDDAKQSTEDLDNEETDGKARRRFLLRYYRVFNLEQCELPQTVLDKLPKTERTSTTRSRRPNGSSPQCPTRQRFNTQAQRRSTARSPIELPCRRANFSRALKNTTPQRCMRPSTAPASEAPCARRHLRSRSVRFRRLLKRRIVRGNGSRLPLRGSRHYSRSHRESGRVRGRLA